MNSSGRHRSTRDRPAKAPLSEDAVVDAALTILKSEGPEAVTMRRVAAALDTGAASLYVCVAGREGLLRAMLDRVTATIVLEAPDPSRWRAQLHSLLVRMRRALVDHPGIAAMTLADPPVTDGGSAPGREHAGNPARRRPQPPGRRLGVRHLRAAGDGRRP